MSVLNANVITRNEDVTDFIIGKFNDERLLKTGALLFKRITTKMSTSIKKLAGNRALQVAFGRFLSNKKCTNKEIEKFLANKTNNNCKGKKHVLCIQDTVEINYSKQPTRKIQFGKNRTSNTTKDRGARGFVAHPCLVVNAENKDILGLSSIKVWTRSDKELLNRKNRTIEEKESYKWIEVSEGAKHNISNAEMMTMISDRESDIYELFNRVLASKNSIAQYMQEIKVCGTYKLELSSITGVRKKQIVEIAVKHSVVELQVPNHTKSNVNNKKIKLTCIEAEEFNKDLKAGKKNFWRLFTTHKINTFDDAKKIIEWYADRWLIEQVFRTVKKEV